MISLSALITAVIVLIVVGLIFGILWWALGACGVPEPFNKVARVVLVLAAALVCVAVLLSLIGVRVFSP